MSAKRVVASEMCIREWKKKRTAAVGPVTGGDILKKKKVRPLSVTSLMGIF